MTWDEHFRLVEMLVIFGVLMPISMWNWLGVRTRYFSLSMNVHVFGSVLYVVDNMRKRSHKLSWIFNMPALVFWLLDFMISCLFYRNNPAEIVSKEV